MKPINLAKCKIGQRVKLRNGAIYAIYKKDRSAGANWPVQLDNNGWYNNQGESISAKSYDIIALLPLPKKKAKTAKPKLLEISDAGDGNAMARIALKLHKSAVPKPDSRYVKVNKIQIRTLIKILEDLL